MTFLLFAQLINEPVSAIQQGLSWGIAVAISLTAAFLAVSLVSWLLHRS
jgi:hypothetical protein